MKKRLFSLLLTLVMVVGIIPGFALTVGAAASLVMGETYTVGMAAPAASVTVGGVTTGYTDLAEAIEAAMASEGSTLKLEQDITTAASSPVKIPSGSFTVDLNGKTWTFAGEGLHIRETADIILIDSSSDGTGKLLGHEEFSTVYLYDTAKLEIRSGTLESNSFSLVDMAVYGDSASELTVSGGTLLANGSDSTAITARGALVKVTGGTIISSSRDISHLKGKIDLAEHNDSVGITIQNNTGADVTVSGTTIKLPKGYVMLKDGEIATSLEHGETYTVGMSPDTAEAAWGTDAQHLSGYGTLDDAVKVVETGAFRYVRLLKDVTLPPDKEVCFDLAEPETDGTPLIFDFNGHTITGKRTDDTNFSLFSVGFGFAQGAILRDTSDNPGGIVAEAGRPFYTSNIAVVEGGVYTGSKPASIRISADPAGQIPEIKGGTFRTTGEYSFEAMGDEVIISGGTFCHGTEGAIVLHSNPLISNPVLKLSGKIDIVDETPDTVSADLCIQGMVGEIEAGLDLSAWKGGSLDVMLPTIPDFPAEWQPSIDVDNITLPNAKWNVVDGAGSEVTGTMKDGILYTVKVRYHNVIFYDNSESNWEYIMAAFRMDGILHYDQGARIGESSLYFFEIPEEVTDIYFTNHMPGMPPEIAPEIPQRTASFALEADKTYVYVPGSSGEDDGGTDEDPSVPSVNPAVMQMIMDMMSQKFTTALTAGEGGTVTADRTSVRYNQNITYTITPDEGYAVADVIVDGKSVGAVSVYTLKNVRKNHTIEVVFEKIGWQNPYSDVTGADWFYEDVQFVSENGLMNGTSEDRFSPDDVLTRAMLVTTLWRLAGQPVVNYLMQFEDVPQDEWYTEAIRWAASEGIVLGYGDGIFGTNDSITREQLAVILYRYEQHLGGGFTGMWMFPLRYDDAEAVADWAYEAICWLTMKDVYVTHDGNLLDPGEKATRAETAAFLCRFCKHHETQEANH